MDMDIYYSYHIKYVYMNHSLHGAPAPELHLAVPSTTGLWLISWHRLRLGTAQGFQPWNEVKNGGFQWENHL